MGEDRRGLLRRALTVAAGISAGAALTRIPDLVTSDRLPLGGGYAPAGVASGWSPRGGLNVRWHVPTEQPFVALTFDDGPGPQWTPMVLDVLDRHRAPATFFVVGERLTRHEDLMRHRIGRHELGNHTWAHRDLGKLDEAGVRDQLLRTHVAIRRVAGYPPTLMRPPWGHLGGSTLVIADEFEYDVVMWSHQMREKRYAHNPPAQARDIVDNVQPGSIVLAHDIGARHRLVALNQLDAILNGLHRRGLRPVTVSTLIAAAAAGRASIKDFRADQGQMAAEK
ncbi:polysaccharide deacetylase family protein [Phytohabitans rumicis]|uniref:polysaccharide deacetylase family protein n=1 Tax=Phytohabitans rumicis TaxID=1076125 RepID=UPI0031E73713